MVTFGGLVVLSRVDCGDETIFPGAEARDCCLSGKGGPDGTLGGTAGPVPTNAEATLDAEGSELEPALLG